jgi:LmbE family N-acetylglucosaminyl deacetylase
VITVDLARPARVLAIGAHPDDIEFGCGATLAKWADNGADVHLCIYTDGSKGTWNVDADLAALVAVRTEEQHDAAAVLGAKAVHLLGYVDGELRNTRDTQAAASALLREIRPDVVVTHDPWRQYRLHPDHHHAGMLTVDAIVAARDPHFFPEQGLAPHRPATLLLFEAATVNHVERVDVYVDRKVEALLRHRSQFESTMGIADRPGEQREAFVRRIVDEARAEGLRAGVRAAESFHRIDAL